VNGTRGVTLVTVTATMSPSEKQIECLLEAHTAFITSHDYSLKQLLDLIETLLQDDSESQAQWRAHADVLNDFYNRIHHDDEEGLIYPEVSPLSCWLDKLHILSSTRSHPVLWHSQLLLSSQMNHNPTQPLLPHVNP